MRRLAIIPLLLLLLAIPLPATADESPSGIEATGLDLGPWQGKVVLVDFWASWCGPCRESFPWMNEMVEKYSDRGLVVVAVNVDSDRQAADEFLEGTSFDFQYVFDPRGDLAEAYGVAAMPSSILFDREGRPVFRHSGFRQNETKEYEEHIVAMLEGTAGAGNAGGQITADAGVGARPWDRDLLARRDMDLNTDPLDLAFDDHLYFSKEATSGGRGFGGGGCGCN